jgi:hypothetical protein
VVLRHGLPGALLGVVCLLFPPTRALLPASLAGLLEQPQLYLISLVAVFIALIGFTRYINGNFRLNQLVWVAYLGALSFWEEWVFRAALPYYLISEGVGFWQAVIAVNLVFGLAHYFTLRWKWYWCLGAFFGGVALSNRFADQQDLVLIAGMHWIVTFLNTPRSPGLGRRWSKPAR